MQVSAIGCIKSTYHFGGRVQSLYAFKDSSTIVCYYYLSFRSLDLFQNLIFDFSDNIGLNVYHFVHPSWTQRGPDGITNGYRKSKNCINKETEIRLNNSCLWQQPYWITAVPSVCPGLNAFRCCTDFIFHHFIPCH